MHTLPKRALAVACAAALLGTGTSALAAESVPASAPSTAISVQLDGLELTQKAISRMETGERVVADYELVHLARALEVGVLELLGLEP